MDASSRTSPTLPFSPAAMLDGLLQSTMALVIAADAEGRLVYVNPAFERATGYTFDDVAGKPIWELRPKTDWDLGRRGFFDGSAATFGRRFETRWETRDGSLIHLFFSAQPLRTDAGEPTFRLATAIDVTEVKASEQAARRASDMLDQIAEALVRVDKDLVIQWCNRAAETLYGFSGEELVGQSNEVFLPPGYVVERKAFLKSLFETREPQTRRTRRMRRNGEVIPVDIRVTPILRNDGEVEGFLSISQDARDARRQEEARVRAEEDAAQLAEIVETFLDPVLRFDTGQQVTYANASAVRMLADEGESLLGRRIADLLEITGPLRAFLEETPDEQRQPAVLPAGLVLPTGQVVPFELRMTPQRGADGSYQGCAVIAYDLRVQRRREAELEHAANTDPLTQLSNRRGLEALVKLELVREQRQPSGLAVIVLDLDHFKAVNDNHGHAAGDAVLVEVAEVLRRASRMPLDFPARLGGEEFALVLPRTDPRSALQVAERLREDIAGRTVEHGDTAFSVTASFGVSAWAPGEDGLEPALARADAALYAAKQDGRNRVRGDFQAVA